jgi:hypothetical protein
MSVHSGLGGVAESAHQLAAQHCGKVDAVFALGDQVGDQGAHVPFGAVGGSRPVAVAKRYEQRQRCLAFGLTDASGVVGVSLGQTRSGYEGVDHRARPPWGLIADEHSDAVGVSRVKRPVAAGDGSLTSCWLASLVTVRVTGRPR